MLLSPLPMASAVEPPTYNAAEDVAPVNAEPTPPVEMKRVTKCATSGVLPNSSFDTIPASNFFGAQKVRSVSSGLGQKVAILDSGVNKNSRLPNLTGGGDYVEEHGDGLTDCDHHGTLVAGIIGAQPSSKDGFVGVAPGADIISIRVKSAAWEPAPVDAPSKATEAMKKDADLSATPKTETSVFSDLLAQAVVHAADSGATVIVIPLSMCMPAENHADLRKLSGALHYAATNKNVVIVAAAGNTMSEVGCGTNSVEITGGAQQMPKYLSIPAMFSQYVLSVGGATTDGIPYIESMSGPWVGVAAPATNIVSLNPSDGKQGTLVNAKNSASGDAYPIQGTSYAAAYVAGLAALVRERHPELYSYQVIQRIMNSAKLSGNLPAATLGAGFVDIPLAVSGTVEAGPRKSPDTAPWRVQPTVVPEAPVQESPEHHETVASPDRPHKFYIQTGGLVALACVVSAALGYVVSRRFH